MVNLNASTLVQIEDRVPGPSYDRSALSTGVVHFGVGAFHRSHQAMYLDRLMNDGRALDWAITGVGLLPADKAIRDALNSQDGLYTLVEKPPSGAWEPRVIGSIRQVLFGPDDAEQILSQMTAEQTRIVSLTVTEGGYNTSDVTGEFIDGNPAVQRDLEPDATPGTWFGFVVEALAPRPAPGGPP